MTLTAIVNIPLVLLVHRDRGDVRRHKTNLKQWSQLSPGASCRKFRFEELCVTSGWLYHSERFRLGCCGRAYDLSRFYDIVGGRATIAGAIVVATIGGAMSGATVYLAFCGCSVSKPASCASLLLKQRMGFCSTHSSCVCSRYCLAVDVNPEAFVHNS